MRMQSHKALGVCVRMCVCVCVCVCAWAGVNDGGKYRHLPQAVLFTLTDVQEYRDATTLN